MRNLSENPIHVGNTIREAKFSNARRVARYIFSPQEISIIVKQTDYGHEFMKDSGDEQKAVIISPQLAGWVVSL